MARPIKLTPALQRKMVKLVKGGVTATAAARMSGISEATWETWKNRGRSEEEPFLGLLVAVREAEASVQAMAEQALYKAFTGMTDKKVRKKLEKSETTGQMVLVEEIREHTTRVYPGFALSWLERRARDDWSPPKAKEEVEPGPDSVTAGPAYTDPWMPPKDGDDGDD